MRKNLSTLAISILIFLSFVHVAMAKLEVYPLYGYNVEENICQVKQASAESEIQENLTGEYWSLRECRVENLKVFFNTGSGIAIWFLMVLGSFCLNFFIYSKFKEVTLKEKQSSFTFELVCIGLVLFFIMLLQHYFSVPYAYYDYGSDIDHIVYANFIYPQLPMYYAVAYLIFVIIKIISLKRSPIKE